LIFFRNFFFTENILSECEWSVPTCFGFVWYKSIFEFIASVVPLRARLAARETNNSDQE